MPVGLRGVPVGLNGQRRVSLRHSNESDLLEVGQANLCFLVLNQDRLFLLRFICYGGRVLSL